MSYPLLETITGPQQLKALPVSRLPELAQEIRQAIVDQVSQSGGHLAPNLGVVELTIALHYVFDLPHDRLLFDVGHQCYPHKLLTGRQGSFPGLRTSQGMSGFPEPRESEYDLFSVGHAGTGVATAVGMARGDDMLAGGPGKSDRHAVTLVGDASIVNGVALEGLNNAGTLKRQFLVVLNDNGMSIAPPQGAMAGYFDKVRVSHTYHDFKKRGKEALEHVPGGSFVEELYHRGSEMFKAMIANNHLFEHFGLVCVGPMDGHDLPTMVDMLNEVKDIERPVLLHAKTIKGKGFDFSEGDATAFHSPKPFKVEGCRVEVSKSGRSFATAFSEAMTDVMTRDEKVFAVTAAMPDGTGLAKVMPRFPDRTLDTGICESHAMDMCAGMAKSGVKPFFVLYSTFVQRAFDQMFQEVALQGHAVRLCLDRAGFVGGDGAVHHGFQDIAMFSPLPGVIQLAACDEPNLRAGLEFMRTYDDGASIIRYPRDKVPAEPLFTDDQTPAFELGKARLMIDSAGGGSSSSKAKGKAQAKRTPDLAILAYGVMVYQAAEAVAQLHQQGYDVALYDARFAMPVDIDLIEKLTNAGSSILTVEDHALAGGFGANVLEAANARGLSTQRIARLGHPRRWIYQDSRDNQLTAAGLDSPSIARRARQMLGSTSGPTIETQPDVVNEALAAAPKT